MLGGVVYLFHRGGSGLGGIRSVMCREPGSRDRLSYNAVTSALKISMVSSNNHGFLFCTKFTTGPGTASYLWVFCLFGVCFFFLKGLKNKHWDFIQWKGHHFRRELQAEPRVRNSIRVDFSMDLGP